MRPHSIEEIREYIKCPQFGDIKYGRWGSLKLEVRETLKQLCEVNKSMDYIIKKQQECIDKAISETKYLISNCDITDYQGEKIINILKGEYDEISNK